MLSKVKYNENSKNHSLKIILSELKFSRIFKKEKLCYLN